MFVHYVVLTWCLYLIYFWSYTTKCKSRCEFLTCAYTIIEIISSNAFVPVPKLKA